MSELLNQEFDFARLVPRLIDQAFALGYQVTLGEAWRSPEEAARNAARGAGIKNSLHTKRMAIDLMLYKDGTYLTATEDYEPLGLWWEAQDPRCRWGGRFGDGDHYSMEWQGVR